MTHHPFQVGFPMKQNIQLLGSRRWKVSPSLPAAPVQQPGQSGNPEWWPRVIGAEPNGWDFCPFETNQKKVPKKGWNIWWNPFHKFIKVTWCQLKSSWKWLNIWNIYRICTFQNQEPVDIHGTPPTNHLLYWFSKAKNTRYPYGNDHQVIERRCANVPFLHYPGWISNYWVWVDRVEN